jgi:acetyl esterase/lipase
MRALNEQLMRHDPLPESLLHAEHVVPGDPGVTLSVHRPVGAEEPLPCLYWIHGGGMIAGSHRMDDGWLRGWSDQLRCVTVSVDYRLAPEAPYPAGLDDCAAGLRWVFEHAKELGVDPGAIGVAGGSGGGNLAAALALRARDSGDMPLAFQLLIVPMLDDRQVTASSRWPSSSWDPISNETAWRAYLGPLYGGDVPPLAAPARATDLAGLPPTYISAGGADIFLDENIQYAQALMHAGVSTELHVFPDAPHGFQPLAPDTPLGRRANSEVDEWLAATLDRVRGSDARQWTTAT